MLILQRLVIILIALSLGGLAMGGTPAGRTTRGPDRESTPTGILYDRVVPLSRIDDHSGSETDGPIGLRHWRQIYYEIWRASLKEPTWPGIEEIRERAGQSAREGQIPIGFMNFKYDRTGVDAGTYREHRAFAAAALKDHTYRGAHVVFAVNRDWYFTNDPAVLTELYLDFGDGLGFRSISFPRECRVSYAYPGRKTVRVRLHFEDGEILHGSFYFDVRQLQTPMPHDTLTITATIPYLGEYASGEAYIYLGESHDSLSNPVIVIEGFDIDNTMSWEVLYETMNQEGMVESLRTRGFDAVVLDFTDATDHIQRNSFVAVELIEQVNALIPACADLAIVGASMGGLIGRHALAYMEMHALEHNVRTFISFDAPQKGANIPLGMQYWIKFFSVESEAAGLMLQQLGAPAPRQMLIYYLTDPPGTSGESDSLFARLQSDFAALGGYPMNLRKVAIANGSGHMVDQGFAPGEQIILYEYNSLLVDIIGNVWAVPDGTNHIIFDGLIDRFWPLPDDQMTVYVEGTRPYDSAPGGTRASMAQMDSTEAPYGDIIALYDNHCFIPTISALDLDTVDLFYDIANDPDILAHTPFDTVYYPIENQEHVAITAESRDWFLTEIERGTLAGVQAHQTFPPQAVLAQNYPNPFSRRTTIGLCLDRPVEVDLEVYNVEGRLVGKILQDRLMLSGDHQVVFETCGLTSGVYFYRLTAGKQVLTRRMLLLQGLSCP